MIERDRAAVVRLPDLFDRLAGELEHASSATDQVETVVCRLTMTNDKPSPADLAELQKLDYVRQVLDALTDCLKSVSHECPHEVEVDLATALNGFPLRDVANRLQAIAMEEPSSTSGDVDLL